MHTPCSENCAFSAFSALLLALGCRLVIAMRAGNALELCLPVSLFLAQLRKAWRHSPYHLSSMLYRQAERQVLHYKTHGYFQEVQNGRNLPS